jgi:GT2 family glycosyltransferase
MIQVIMLSNTANPQIHKMTQNAINSLRESLPDCGITVVETNQGEVKYEGALVYQPQEKFNYNRFINLGYAYVDRVRESAEVNPHPYVMIANNDLIFDKNWWKAMERAFKYDKLDSASPINEGWFQHLDIKNDVELGWGIGKHFCGWALVFKREVFEKLLPLDEQFEFFCQDNDLANTMQSLGMKHALVKKSRVKHLTSQSHSLVDSATHRHYTDDMVELYHKKWG